MDDAGFDTAHLVGNSLGGYVALQVAARGRARSVVAFAPAGGWAEGDDSYKETLGFFAAMQDRLEGAAPHAEAIAASSKGRRRATEFITTNFEHIPAALISHQIRGAAGCEGARPLIEYALRAGYRLDAESITCPVRIVWGTADRILPWPAAAVRYRNDWLPNADWVELDGIGHCPQLDVPLEARQLILGFTNGWPWQLIVARPCSPGLHDLDHLPHLDIPGRLRRRPESKPREPDRRRRYATARVGVRDRQLASAARDRRRPSIERQ